MPRKSRSRKQRVVLRSKQRVVLHRRLRGSVSTLAVIAVVLIAGRVISSRTASTPGYVQRHTPALEIKAPETLADLPLVKQTPVGSFLLWLPGSEWRLRKQWMKEYPGIGHVEFDKQFSNNKIVARLDPRIPLVRWDDRGVDKEGIVFALASSKWAVLPKANFHSTASMPVLGRWMGEVSRIPTFWGQITGISQDARGEMWLDMQTGTHVAWGLPESAVAREKARCLAMVLDDAHKRLSGASTADVRFFEEGRVIVKPKLAT